MRSTNTVAAVLLLSLTTLGCASSWAMSNTGFCAILSVADVRVVYRECTAADVGLAVDKQPMSEQAQALAEEIIPLVVEGVVKGVCPIP